MGTPQKEGRWEEAVRSATFRIRMAWVGVVVWLAAAAYAWTSEWQIVAYAAGAMMLLTIYSLVPSYRKRSLLYRQRSRDRQRRRHRQHR
jgi:low affinity Fe/Cu permease